VQIVFKNIRFAPVYKSITEVIMENKKILQNLQQSWLHSHEEDTETETVYRPADYDFPLSRGRSGFELKPDNKLNEINIAPTDGTTEEEGSWQLENHRNNLKLQLNPGTTAKRDLQIRSVSQDCLIVKK
jgi:hypothetical protein